MNDLSRAILAAALLAALVSCSGGGGDDDGGGGPAPACQGASYTGGDPAGDADGDGLSNGAECAAGTSPSAADSDGDGLGDGEEASAGTNPLAADTDGDGLQDGTEVARGTSPFLPDTDGDGLQDGAEAAAGTSPTAADTDGDGIADGAEAAYHTDPLDADTDGDGLTDGDEVALGRNPVVPDPSDEVCDVLQACARDALVPVRWEDRAQGDYRVALPDGAVVGDLRFPDAAPPGRLAVTGFDLTAPAVAGFVLSMDEPVAGGAPAAQLNALYARLASTASTPWTSTELVAGRAVQSWDGFPAVVGARVNLTGVTGDAGAIREAVVARLAALADGSFLGLPPGDFGTGPFVLGLEVLSRRNVGGDAHRVVVVGAIAPKGWFDDRTQATRIVASDLTGGTALGQSGDGEGTECEPMPVTGDPRADFVWMSDVSGSTADERDPIKASTAAVFDQLAQLGIDFRMGVVRHTANSMTNEEPAGRLIAPGFTSSQTTFAGYWDDPGADYGLEYGLTAVDDVVGPGGTALPRSATPVATKLREGVKLVVIYVSDEHAQEVERTTDTRASGCSASAACGCAGVADNTKEDLTPSELTCVQGKVQPFIQHLSAEDAIAFGIIAPPPGGCDMRPPDTAPWSREVGWGYSQVIDAMGGSYGSVCASNPGSTLNDIMNAVAGAASSFVLGGTPIAMTLKVVVTEASAPVCDPTNPGAGRREVARSQVNGFDYDPVSNTIFFVGPSRPAAGDTITISYREWADQTSNPNPDPEACDCGGCPTGYFCYQATCSCVFAG